MYRTLSQIAPHATPWHRSITGSRALALYKEGALKRVASEDGFIHKKATIKYTSSKHGVVQEVGGVIIDSIRRR